MSFVLSTRVLAAGLAFVASAHAQEIACPSGSDLVYWSEEGPPEDYRDTYVFDAPQAEERVLHHLPVDDAATWLTERTGGTGIAFRVLVPADGEGARTYRFLDVRADDRAPAELLGRTVTALVVDMTVYWPVCVESELIATWAETAGP